MSKLKAAVIGCGGRGNAHALGYSLSPHVTLAACADCHAPAAERMASAYGFDAVYTDYREMLAREAPDIVSMCLWPDLHLEAILACLDAPVPPRLINAEKPMAPTYGEAVRMHEACEDAGVMLTLSHQRRFGRTFRRAKELIDAEVIGDLQRMEMDCSNLFDWGTHWFDMMLFYNHDMDADWVMGQVGCAADQLVFGARVETAGISYIKWPNGVTGLLTTGAGTGSNVAIRVIGTKGIIEVDHGILRLLKEGAYWQTVAPTLQPIRGDDTSRHLINAVECLLNDEESTLCSRNALRATELIFATYESARTRKRVVLPLRVDDSPLIEMVDSGKLVIPDWPAFLTDEEQEDGFRLLFNGHDLNGWDAAPPQAWHAKWGILRGQAAPAILRTQEVYADFTLSFEFRLGSRAEAALVLRAGENGTGGLEIPLKDDRAEPVTDSSSGALKGIRPPQQSPRIGGTGWCWIEVTLTRNRVTISFRDIEVLNLPTDEIPELRDLPTQGNLAIRLDKGWFHARNIMIKPL